MTTVADVPTPRGLGGAIVCPCGRRPDWFDMTLAATDAGICCGNGCVGNCPGVEVLTPAGCCMVGVLVIVGVGLAVAFVVPPTLKI